ncbi:MAG: alanine dehydrogenase [Candidatus Brockarchaeota archaeon]|nr:alanine dehydrogenase [Candidatus Brockarchaeota archaeon]MBO3842360.1 alanine dehydrogenase [Candidatus Brockarchaeota archaeon]
MKVSLIMRKDIERIVSMRELMGAMEDAFRAKAMGRVQMPMKVYVTLPDGDFRTMMAYIPDLDMACVKIVNVHPNNPWKHGLPTVMATMVLIEPDTGRPLAIMDGTYLTSMRTGATGGVAAKHLARRNSRVIGMVGAGSQARTQLLALNEVFNIEEVRVCAKTRTECEVFVKDMQHLGLRILIEEGVEETVRGCDIIVTTTPVTQPLVENEWIEDGMHINAIGADAPGKEELDPEILKRAKVVVDDYEQACHYGELNVPVSKGIFKPEQIHAELGEIIVGRKAGRTSDDEITVFDSTGLAIQDLAAAALVYRKAGKLGISSEVELL